MRYVRTISSFMQALEGIQRSYDTPDSETKHNQAMNSDSAYRLAITIDTTATPEENSIIKETIKEELLTFYNSLSATIRRKVRYFYKTSKSIDGTYKPTGRDAQNFFNRIQHTYAHGSSMSTPDFIYLLFNYCL